MRRVGILVALLACGLCPACDQIEALKTKLLGTGDSRDQEPPELTEAKELLEGGQIDSAIQRLEHYTQANPASAQGFYYLGLCYLEAAGPVADATTPLTELELKSRDAFQRALSLNPRHALASVGLGDLYARRVTTRRRRGVDPAEDPRRLSMEAYQNAVSIDPKLPESQLHYAQFLERLGQLDEAEQAYKAAADAAATIPEQAPDYYMTYGRFLASRQGRLQEAIDQYELAQMFRQDDLDIQREIAVAQARMGQEYFENEQYSLAEDTLGRAYDLFPDKNDPEALEAASTLQKLRGIRRR